jgi:hypothetical protein
LNVFQWHADTFDIPHGAAHLVSSERCPNQAFRKGAAVAIQFHLEPSPEDVPRWCSAYASELKQEGLSQDGILETYAAESEHLRNLAFTVMKNFLA